MPSIILNTMKKYVFEKAGIFEAGEAEEIEYLHTLEFAVTEDNMNNESRIFENISISLLAEQVD